MLLNSAVRWFLRVFFSTTPLYDIIASVNVFIRWADDQTDRLNL